MIRYPCVCCGCTNSTYPVTVTRKVTLYMCSSCIMESDDIAFCVEDEFGRVESIHHKRDKAETRIAYLDEREPNVLYHIALKLIQ